MFIMTSSQNLFNVYYITSVNKYSHKHITDEGHEQTNNNILIYINYNKFFKTNNTKNTNI